MSFRQDKTVAIERLWIMGIVTHDGEKQCSDDIGGGCAARRMAAPGLAGGPHAVDAELGCLIV